MPTDTMISARTAADTLTGTEIVGVIQGGADKRTTAQAIADLAAASTDPGTGGGEVTTAKVTVSSAEILNINSVPKELIPAPGAGKIIVPLAVVIRKTFVTTAYTGSLSLQFAPGTVFSVILSSELGFDVDTTVKVNTANGGSHDGAAYGENLGLYVYALGANPAAGDGTLTFYITYTTVTL